MKRFSNQIKLVFLPILVMGLLSLTIGSGIVPVQAMDNQLSLPCSSWNLATDFRTSPNQENPNRDSCDNLGVWEFFKSADMIRNPTYYTLMPDFTSALAGASGLNGWYENGAGSHISFNAMGTTYVSGAIVWPPNTVDVHPGPGHMAIMAWHSPLNGYISITGGVSDNNPGCGDGILWYLDKNTTNVASGSHGNGGSQLFASGTGGSGLSALQVSVGDVIYLAIHPNGNYYCDDTRVDLSIDVTDPSTPTPTPSVCTTWDLANDFRVWPNQENPNRDLCNNLGVWDFLKSTDLTRDPVNYTLMPDFTSALAGVSGLNSWYMNGVGGHISFNATGTTFASGAMTWPPNTVDVHPGPGHMAIVAWHSPLSGYISVVGGVSDNNPGCGDGVLWYFDKNMTNIASGGYANGGSQLFANGTGGAGLSALQVSAGDTIYLAIHPNGYWDCDDTGVNLSINVTNAPTSTPTATLTGTSTATFTPSATATYIPTYTSTATFTPTYTKTSTPTLTFTPTFTSTSTFVPGTPHSNGSGTCWSSQESWDTYTVYFDIDLEGDFAVPAEWVVSIHNAKDTWDNVIPSQFQFVRELGNTNTVRYESPDNPKVLAVSAPPPDSGNITSGYIKINPAMLWDVNNTPSQNDPDHNGSTNTYNVQNVVTHEFGHWLFLNDIDDPNCTQVTMDHDVGFGEISKITLDTADENAINWQYP